MGWGRRNKAETVERTMGGGVKGNNDERAEREDLGNEAKVTEIVILLLDTL